MRTTTLLLAACLPCLAGCVGIRPLDAGAAGAAIRSDPGFWTLGASTDGLRIRCRPVLDSSESSAFFDADLPAMGVLPVWMELEWLGPDTPRLDDGGWALDVGGARCRSMSLAALKKKVGRFYGVGYTIQAERERFSDLLVGLSLSGRPLERDKPLTGAVFFPAPRGAELSSTSSLDLRLRIRQHSSGKMDFQFTLKTLARGAQGR